MARYWITTARVLEMATLAWEAANGSPATSSTSSPPGPESGMTSNRRMEVKTSLPCVHLGQPTGELVDCQICGLRVRLKVMHCKIHGGTLPTVKQNGTPSCIGCADYHS